MPAFVTTALTVGREETRTKATFVEIWRVNRDMVCSATLCSCLTCNLVIAQAQLEMAKLPILWPLRVDVFVCQKSRLAVIAHLLHDPFLWALSTFWLCFFALLVPFAPATTYQLIISYLSNYLLTLLAAI